MRFLCAEDNGINAEILTELFKIQGAGKDDQKHEITDESNL